MLPAAAIQGIRAALNPGEAMEGMARGLSPIVGEQVRERHFGYPVREATEEEARAFAEQPGVWAREIGGSLVVNPGEPEMSDPAVRASVLVAMGAVSWIRKHRARWEDLPEPTEEQRSLLDETGVPAGEFVLRSAAVGMAAAGTVEPSEEQRQFIEWMHGLSRAANVVRSRGRIEESSGEEGGEGPPE